MPRGLTERGRNKLRGPRRMTLRRRGIRPSYRRQVTPIIADGTQLSDIETIVYQALSRLQIPFQTQIQRGGGRKLGGAMIDFYLPFHNTIIEVQGPLHDTDRGAAQDVVRKINRERYFPGATVVELDERECWQIHEDYSRMFRYLPAAYRST